MGGRKWKLAQQTFWVATVMAMSAFVYLTSKGNDPMGPLYWWATTAGGLFTLYGGANIVGKAVSKNGESNGS